MSWFAAASAETAMNECRGDSGRRGGGGRGGGGVGRGGFEMEVTSARGCAPRQTR
jgi:hypothetical protein